MDAHDDDGLFIEEGLGTVRLAQVQGGVVTRLRSQRLDAWAQVGDIFCGRVTRLAPHLQAAFVDIGGPRPAFLHVDDIAAPDLKNVHKPREGPAQHRKPPNQALSALIKAGQAVLVQIKTAPTPDKGPRLTRRVALAGQALVYLPTQNHLAISQRITSDTVRSALAERLTRIAQKLGGGWVARTLAQDAATEHLDAEAHALTSRWQDVKRTFALRQKPGVLSRAPNLMARMAHELVSSHTRRIVVSPKERVGAILGAVAETAAGAQVQVVPAEALTKSAMAGITRPCALSWHLAESVGRRVALPGLGEIVIDETEAMVTIDVNSKRHGGGSAQKAALALNLAAAHEVARQLKLRDLGGIVAVDFVDMAHKQDREVLEQALQQALLDDEKRTLVLPINAFGVLMLTRRRSRPSLRQSSTQACDRCAGLGIQLRAEDVAHTALTWAQRHCQQAQPSALNRWVLLNVHPDVAQLLDEKARARVDALELYLGAQVGIVARSNFTLGHIEVLDSDAKGLVYACWLTAGHPTPGLGA